jgi:hypothetical protein
MEKFISDKSNPSEILIQHEAHKDEILDVETPESQEHIKGQIESLNRQTEQAENHISSLKEAIGDLEDGEKKHSLVGKMHDLIKEHRDVFLEAAAVAGRRYILMNLVATHSIVPLINNAMQKTYGTYTPDNQPAFSQVEEAKIMQNEDRFTTIAQTINANKERDLDSPTGERTRVSNPVNVDDIDLDKSPKMEDLYQNLHSHDLAGGADTYLREYGSKEYIDFLIDTSVLQYERNINSWVINEDNADNLLNDLQFAVPMLEALPDTQDFMKYQNLMTEEDIDNGGPSQPGPFPYQISSRALILISLKESPYFSSDEEKKDLHEYARTVTEQPHEVLFEEDNISFKFVESEFPDTREAWNKGKVQKFLEHPMIQKHLEELKRFSEENEHEVVLYFIPNDRDAISAARNMVFESYNEKSVGYLSFDMDQFDFGTLSNELTEAIFSTIQSTVYTLQVEETGNTIKSNLCGSEDYQLLTLTRDRVLEDLRNHYPEDMTLKEIVTEPAARDLLLHLITERYESIQERIRNEDSSMYEVYGTRMDIQDIAVQTEFEEKEILSLFNQSIFENSYLPIQATFDRETNNIIFSLNDKELSEDELDSLDISLKSLRIIPYE